MKLPENMGYPGRRRPWCKCEGLICYRLIESLIVVPGLLFWKSFKAFLWKTTIIKLQIDCLTSPPPWPRSVPQPPASAWACPRCWARRGRAPPRGAAPPPSPRQRPQSWTWAPQCWPRGPLSDVSRSVTLLPRTDTVHWTPGRGWRGKLSCDQREILKPWHKDNQYLFWSLGLCDFCTWVPGTEKAKLGGSSRGRYL